MFDKIKNLLGNKETKIQQFTVESAPKVKKGGKRYSREIVPKSVSKVRKDIKDWKQALDMARKAEEPKRFPLYNLYDDILDDGTITSQIQNRTLLTLASPFEFKKNNGEVDEELTDLIKKEKWLGNIFKLILATRYFGHSLIEFDYDDKGLFQATLIPRQNVDPVNGILYLDYTEDKGVEYRKQREYGVWLVEAGEDKELGLLNKCVPIVLFKRFALSCWSELCEIAGIPPRFLKTDTQDPGMLKRAEKMMTDMGAAAWFIIDENEEFGFAKTADLKGDVYNNLIAVCKEELSLIISGAVIGQDTKFGSNNKDESAKEMLYNLVDSDMLLIEQEMNTTIIPALAQIGIIPAGTIFAFQEVEDIEAMWKMVTETMKYYELDIDWLNETFGLKITGLKQGGNPPLESGSHGLDFFV